MEDKRIDLVVDNYSKSKNVYQPLHDAWLRFRDLYFQKLPSQLMPDVDKSALVPPHLYIAVEDTKALLFEALFGDEDYLLAEPALGGSVEGARSIEAVVNYRLREEEFFLKAHKIIDLFAKFGVGVVVFPVENVVDRYVVEEPYYDKLGNPIVDDSGEVISRRVIKRRVRKRMVTKVIEPFGYFPDPVATCPDERRWEIFQRYESIQSLRDAGVYEDLDKVKAQDFNRQAGDELGIMDNKFGEMNDDSNFLVEVKEQARLVDGGLEVTTVANDMVVIRYAMNPFGSDKFYSEIITGNPSYRDMFGIGAIENIEDLFYELFQKRNQRIDNINLSMGGINLAPLGDDVPDTVFSDPFRILQTNEPERWKHIDIPNNTQDNFAECAVIESDIKNVTKTYNQPVGRPAQRKETATAVMAQAQGSETAFKIQVMRIARSLAKVYERYWIDAQLNMEDEEFVKILGVRGYANLEQFKSPLDVKGRYYFKAKVSSVSPSVVKQQQEIALYQQLFMNPHVDKRAAAVDLLRAHKKVNIDEWIPDPSKDEIWATEESILIANGVQLPPVHPMEPHQNHISTHQRMVLLNNIPAEHLSLMDAHIQDHQQYIAPKQGGSQPKLPGVVNEGEMANQSVNQGIQPDMGGKS